MQQDQESLGKFLKKNREQGNISIEQVAYATRISLKMLRALEEDDHQALPAPTFVRGYLQAYAKYVRLDFQDLLLRYQHQLAIAPDSKRTTIKSHYFYVRERYQEKKRLLLVIVLFTVMLGVAGTYFLLKSKRERHKHGAQVAQQEQQPQQTPAPATAPPPAATPVANKDTKELKDSKDAKDSKEPAKTAATTPTPTPPAAIKEPTPPTPAPAPSAATAPATPPASPAETAQNENKTYNLQLKAKQDTWLRFQTDSDEVRDLTLREGKTIVLKANKVIKIFSGNLNALQAKMNGKELTKLSTADRAMSSVLPETEIPNYPLPLFPQFQNKAKNNSESQNSSSSTGDDAKQNSATN